MLIIDVVRFILYILSLLLIVAWYLTGRKKKLLMRLAGVTIIIASLLTFYTLMSRR